MCSPLLMFHLPPKSDEKELTMFTIKEANTMIIYFTEVRDFNVVLPSELVDKKEGGLNEIRQRHTWFWYEPTVRNLSCYEDHLHSIPHFVLHTVFILHLCQSQEVVNWFYCSSEVPLCPISLVIQFSLISWEIHIIANHTVHHLRGWK